MQKKANEIQYVLVLGLAIYSLLFAIVYSTVGFDTISTNIKALRRTIVKPEVNSLMLSDKSFNKNLFARVEIERPLESDYSYRSGGSIGLGVYLPELELYSGSMFEYKQILDYEEKIDHKLQYLLYFNAWGDQDKDFPSEAFNQLRSLELTPIITWEPWSRDFDNPTQVQRRYSFESIIDGDHDRYIREWAKDAKETESLIILRFAHEMASEPGIKIWYPWQGQPEEYINAHRHIVNIFREEGVSNVKFMWNPLEFSGDIVDLYYPGESYVDYIGLTVLNHGKEAHPFSWNRCNWLYEGQYNWAKTYDHPIIITEIGSAEQGGSKAEWYGDCFDRVVASDKVIGLISIEIPEDHKYPVVDWRIDSSTAAFDAFIEAISDRRFK